MLKPLRFDRACLLEAWVSPMAPLDRKQRAQREPLIEVTSNRTVEVFYADCALARSFGLDGAGWAWWSCMNGLTPESLPIGPFATAYSAYRNAVLRAGSRTERTEAAPIKKTFGDRIGDRSHARTKVACGSINLGGERPET